MMTVGELKELLSKYKDDAHVCIGREDLSKRAYEIEKVKKWKLHAFYGNDESVVYLFAGWGSIGEYN